MSIISSLLSPSLLIGPTTDLLAQNANQAVLAGVGLSNTLQQRITTSAALGAMQTEAGPQQFYQKIAAPIGNTISAGQQLASDLTQQIIDRTQANTANAMAAAMDFGVEPIMPQPGMGSAVTGVRGSKAFVAMPGGLAQPAGQQPLPEPIPLSWWCHQCPAVGGGAWAVTATQSADPICPGDIVSGPYASRQLAEQCLSGIPTGGGGGGNPPTWWCHTLRDGSHLCTTDALQRGPQDFIRGPYPDLQTCQGQCGLAPPGPGQPPGPGPGPQPQPIPGSGGDWWCHTNPQGGQYCDQNSAPRYPGDNPQGPFPSAAACGAACGAAPPGPAPGPCAQLVTCPNPVVNVPPCPEARIVIVPCPAVPPPGPSPQPQPVPPPGPAPPPQPPGKKCEPYHVLSWLQDDCSQDWRNIYRQWAGAWLPGISYGQSAEGLPAEVDKATNVIGVEKRRDLIAKWTPTPTELADAFFVG